MNVLPAVAGDIGASREGLQVEGKVLRQGVGTAQAYGVGRLDSTNKANLDEARLHEQAQTDAGQTVALKRCTLSLQQDAIVLEVLAYN